MMGRVQEQGQLFYRFRLDDHVPEDHFLRQVDRFLDFKPLRAELAPLYSHTGRPSVDPELMIRMLLIGYLYGIRSETRLCEEVHLNLAYRWFCRLGLEGQVPERSTFSKNRHGRFAGGEILRLVFETVVRVCADKGLVGGTGGLVDGSTVHADANRDRRDTPDAIQATWAVKDMIAHPVQAYLDDLESAAAHPPDGPKHKPPKYISETDPQAAWSLKDGPGRFSYEVNYLADDLHAIIVDVEATPARLSQEIVAAKAMLERSAGAVGFAPQDLAADKSYGTGPFLSWLFDRDVTPYIPVLDRKAQTFGKLTRDAFDYDADRDVYVCPQGHELPLRSVNAETRVKRYKAKASQCRDCPLRAQCTDAPSRTVVRLMDEEARQKARDLAETDAFQTARTRRKKIEMLFAHLKRWLKLTRLRLRGLSGANEEFLLAATAQNLKRLVKLVPT
ncbi:MAG: IS1182 family transposase [Alphaproteobacteria bacterium]|nr:IS1182 family transposase [Alphaproteobacteria bacterium]